jgi:4-hydroxybenzoate polyprenyltransferase
MTSGRVLEERRASELLGRQAALTIETHPRPGVISDLLRTFRPRQWIKNGFVMIPAIFGGAFHADQLGRVGLTVLAFCLASSGLYVINDIADRDADRLHEWKRNRPIAAGRLGIPTAVLAAVLLVAASSGIGMLAGANVLAIIGAYCVATLAYSAWLKHLVIVDVLVLASGFVLRVAAGAAAAAIVPSEWLLLCTLFLALFLGFGKRYNELALLGETASSHRRVLEHYTAASLGQFLNASMLGTLFSYCLYTFFSAAGINHRGLMLTIPFAVYGVFRYTLLMETRRDGGAPEEVILRDRPLQLTAVLWIAVAVVVLYGPQVTF